MISFYTRCSDSVYTLKKKKKKKAPEKTFVSAFSRGLNLETIISKFMWIQQKSFPKGLVFHSAWLVDWFIISDDGKSTQKMNISCINCPVRTNYTFAIDKQSG